MKKWVYLLSGILIGAVVATSGSAAAAQIKSMIGQKVTGELTVVVNGKELADKGAVINGRTNAPVRALVDAVGGNLVLEGKTITITTGTETAPSSRNTNSGSPSPNNPYIGEPESSLLNNKDILENRILKPTIEGRDRLQLKLDEARKGTNQDNIRDLEKELASHEADIQKYTKQLEQVNEALQLLNK